MGEIGTYITLLSLCNDLFEKKSGMFYLKKHFTHQFSCEILDP